MDHLNDKEMLEQMGTPATDRPQSWQEHLNQCQACRQRFEPLEQAWDDLGAWSVSTRGRDLTHRILAQITQIPYVRLSDSKSLLRVAASIVIGLAAGYWAATYTSSAPSKSESASHLQTLGLESATGWSDSFLLASDKGRR